MKFDRIGILGFFFFFMPECQINYFISAINLFYVEKNDCQRLDLLSLLSIKCKKRWITCNNFIPVAGSFV